MHAEGKAGSLVDDSGHFYKPLQVIFWTILSVAGSQNKDGRLLGVL